MKEYYVFGNNEQVRAAGGADNTRKWIPQFTEETSSGIHEIELQTRHFDKRKLFLTGEVTDQMAIDFVSEIEYLAESDEPVTIYINSPGGSVNAGLLIYDVIQAAPFPIDMYCIGMAASMGAIILAGGQKGRRYILPHSKVMIHEPLIEGGMGGSASSIKKTADSILETKKITNSILSKHTGKSLEEVDKATGFDNFMNAEEAVEFGICDEIRNLF